MDFTAVVAAIDPLALGNALGAIAGLMMIVSFAQWAYNQVIGFVDPSDQIDFSNHEINMTVDRVDMDYQDLGGGQYFGEYRDDDGYRRSALIEQYEDGYRVRVWDGDGPDAKITTDTYDTLDEAKEYGEVRD